MVTGKYQVNSLNRCRLSIFYNISNNTQHTVIKNIMKTLEELNVLIIEWGEQKGINNFDKQQGKFIEEIGELSKEVNNEPMDIDKVKLEIGDVYVTIVSLISFIGSEKKNWETSNLTINQRLLKIISLIENFCYLNAIEELKSLCEKLNLNLIECVNLTYEKIKDRKGKTVNGSFFRY